MMLSANLRRGSRARTNQFTMRTTQKRAALLLALVTLAFVGCIPPVEPCSTADLGQKVAACVAREQLECKPTAEGKKDTTCPAYVECKETIDKWEACE